VEDMKGGAERLGNQIGADRHLQALHLVPECNKWSVTVPTMMVPMSCRQLIPSP